MEIMINGFHLFFWTGRITLATVGKVMNNLIHLGVTFSSALLKPFLNQSVGVMYINT